MKITSPAHLIESAEKFVKQSHDFKSTISVCGGTGCLASGCGEVRDALRAELEKKNLTDTVRLLVTGSNFPLAARPCRRPNLPPARSQRRTTTRSVALATRNLHGSETSAVFGCPFQSHHRSV